jgi:hypothetical protein
VLEGEKITFSFFIVLFQRDFIILHYWHRNAQHNDSQHDGHICNIQHDNAHYTEGRVLFMDVLNVTVLSVIILSVMEPHSRFSLSFSVFLDERSVFFLEILSAWRINRAISQF